MHYIRAYIRVHNVLKIIQSFCQFLFTGESQKDKALVTHNIKQLFV